MRFRLVAFVIALSVVAFAADIPDAPSATAASAITRHEPRTAVASPCGSTGCWDYDRPNLTVGQTFRSRNFLIPVGIAEASYWADVGFSLAAIRRGCTEGNPDLPAAPNARDYFANWAKTELLLDVFQWGLVKLNRKPTNVMNMLISGARVGVHMNGVAAAWRCR